MAEPQKCPNCFNEFPSSFENAIEGTAQVIVHNGELSAQIEFECPTCDSPLILEDARGCSFGIDPHR